MLPVKKIKNSNRQQMGFLIPNLCAVCLMTPAVKCFMLSRSQVFLCILATGSGTVRRDCGSCSPKTWPPATWSCPVAAWWKRCRTFSPMIQWSQHNTSAPPLLRLLKRALKRDNVCALGVTSTTAWYYLLFPTHAVFSWFFCVSLPLSLYSLLCTHICTTRWEARCLTAKHTCISCNNQLYSRELYYCPVNS